MIACLSAILAAARIPVHFFVSDNPRSRYDWQPSSDQGTPEARDIMTVSEVADYLPVSKLKIYRLIAKGQLRPFEIGRIWRFKRHDILAVAENGTRAKNA